ncbi:MAG TPA: protein kinase [Thermoanaerobaculia bacterium]|nr:protein kinase [Thermoanaerobaculia bacterium]
MQTLGTYRLISRLGAGGMGEVWRAEDSKLLRQVAIKILPEALAADPEWKDRFLREARTIAQLNHPNIATIYSIDQQDNKLFIAMELIEGEPLAAIIARGPMMPADAVRVAVHVADGLSEAHSKEIVHRDIKPDNIILSPKLVKVLDFGIAKQLGGTADPGLTQGGMVVGTPHYMSPEQALGRTVDPRTDIFSLGVVLYEMLSGRKPFTGEAVTEVLLQIVMNEPRDIAQAAFGITPALANIVRRCMHKQAEERFQSCDEVRAALVNSLKEEPTRARQSSVPTINARKDEVRKDDVRTVADAKPVVTPPPAPAPTAAPVKSGIVQPSSPRYRALVADDDPATRYILGSILVRHQIAFDEAENGAEAVKQLKANQYALVFVDLLMPRIDGWGVIDFLRSRRGAANAPRVFVVTGVQNQKLSTADSDVVAGLLYKPIDVGQIERLVAG